MSDSLDYSLLDKFEREARERHGRDGLDAVPENPQSGHLSIALDDAGLRGAPPWRSIPLWVSNDRADMYFEIYRVAQTPLISGGKEETHEWRWRFCAADGHVLASSSAYPSIEECRDAIDALRRTAGGARVRQLGAW